MAPAIQFPLFYVQNAGTDGKKFELYRLISIT